MRINFELIGGPLNGIYSGDLSQTSTVLTWYHATQGGTIGQDFVIESPGPATQPQRHRYRVTNRAEQNQVIQIAAAYEGLA
jgi:hypothetical protein